MKTVNVVGKIMCRLPQPSSQVRDLGKYLHHEMLERGEMSFVVWERFVLERVDRQPLSQRVIEGMIRDQKFDMGRFKFRIGSMIVPTHMNLCFGDMTMLPISGFPRSLLTDVSHDSGVRNSNDSSLFPTRLSRVGDGVSRNAYRYTHGSRRLKKIATWKPPTPLEHSVSLKDLRQYGDPGRSIGSHGLSEQSNSDKECIVLGPLVPERGEFSAPQLSQSESVPDQTPNGSTLRNAFRMLFWPVRAQQTMAHVASPTHEADNVPEPVELGSQGTEIPRVAELASMQFYHVDSEENKIYQRWISHLGPSMGSRAPMESFELDGIGMAELPG